MELLYVLPESIKPFIEIFGIFASFFALAISFLYFFYPKFKICFYKSTNEKVDNKERLNIKIENGNTFRRKIVDIKCEVTAMKYNNKIVKTLDLSKDEIIVLKRKCDQYTFYAKWNPTNNQGPNLNEYDYIRVRLLSLNFLGVKKQTEGYIKILEITNCEDCNTVKIKKFKKNPAHNNNTQYKTFEGKC